jgi:predicted enzyme related to lactoylglutathione lyase
MSDRKPLPGKFAWFELASTDVRKAQAFYGEVLAWKTQPFPMGALSYEMIFAGDTPDTMIGGYVPGKSDGRPSHWISYVSVEDVGATTKAAVANGGKIIEPPSDIPGVGEKARIADPQGAEVCLIRSVTGDSPDGPALHGRFFWNELHTNDPVNALAFYERVLGYSVRSMDMGPAGTYHIVSKGGVDRGGVTGHLRDGVPPHWLPYVAVDDVDVAIRRARTLDARVPVGPEDIPGIGRFGVLQDPAGAVLAIMKPLLRENGAR